MRATLVYNAKAGGAPPEADIRAKLGDIGWSVHACVPRHRARESLEHGTDVVVAAGGDGTMHEVAACLAGTGIPMVVVPMGTVNNVARSLGVGVDGEIVLAGLNRVRERKVDLGVAVSSAGREIFLEGVGVGIFAHVLGERATKHDKRVRDALSMVATELDAYVPGSYEIEADGRDVSGRYVLAAAMNGKSFGPAMALAPDAKVDDGELDLVLVRPESKEALLRHLRRASRDGDVAFPAFEAQRVRRLVVRADGRWVHVDDRPRLLAGPTEISLQVGAVRVLVPEP